jgi:hypothetical protein
MSNAMTTLILILCAVICGCATINEPKYPAGDGLLVTTNGIVIDVGPK